MCSADCFLGIIAILFPPLPVWVKRGICSADSLINILLLTLGYIPGLLHAWYIIAKFPEADFDYRGPVDAESGRIYVFVHEPQAHGHQHQAGQPKPQGQPQPHGYMNYGTTSAPSSSSAPNPAPAPAPAPAQQQQQHDAGEGSSNMPPPPSYAQVVAGDHKIQTQD